MNQVLNFDSYIEYLCFLEGSHFGSEIGWVGQILTFDSYDEFFIFYLCSQFREPRWIGHILNSDSYYECMCFLDALTSERLDV